MTNRTEELRCTLCGRGEDDEEIDGLVRRARGAVCNVCVGECLAAAVEEGLGVDLSSVEDFFLFRTPFLTEGAVFYFLEEVEDVPESAREQLAGIIAGKIKRDDLLTPLNEVVGIRMFQLVSEAVKEGGFETTRRLVDMTDPPSSLGDPGGEPLI